MQFTVIHSPIDTRDHPVAATNTPIPATLDLRPRCKPVRNQGSTSACAAYSGCSAKEANTPRSPYLNPEFVFDKRADKSINGMHLRDMLSILLKEGTPPEKLIGAPDPAQAKDYKIKSYCTITSIDEVKSMLVNWGPCIAAFPCYNTGRRFWQYTGGATLGGHAVAIVGWTATGFIIRNSWGQLWAEEGYTEYRFDEWGAHWERWGVEDLPSAVPVTCHC